MKQKIVGYGELLLRLSPAAQGSLIEQSELLQMSFAGAEANIIADLALLGHQTGFITALPENPLGRKANQFLQGYGVETNSVIWDKARLGSYYIEHGSSIRGTRVTYDRADSSITKNKISDKDWESLFKNVSHFILTGVTPALSQICRDNIQAALEIAKSKNVKVVFDLNYRRSLWEKEEARKSFESILPYVNILIANTGSAFDVFGIESPAITNYETAKSSTQTVTNALNNLGNFVWIAMTIRLQNNADDNELGGMIKNGKDYFFSNSIKTTIIDRLGGGDAFAAAAIHGIIKGWPANEIINFATAAFALTQTIHGDINYLSEQEIMSTASGDTQGHVKR
ncbi:MAG: sugar kinase [Ginsengibacter sp.]